MISRDCIVEKIKSLPDKSLDEILVILEFSKAKKRMRPAPILKQEVLQDV